MPHDSHWQHWHEQYAEPDGALGQRLTLVQGHIARWLVHGSAGPERRQVLSLCAGDGRDVLTVLDARRGETTSPVKTVLVELDDELASAARRRAGEAGLERVDVRTADAGAVACYADDVPADLLLLCGIFGNIDDADVRRTVAAVPQLVAGGGTVIWTRSRRAPDLTPQIRAWFGEAGCEEVAFNAPAGELFAVGVHRFVGEPQVVESDAVLFRFRTGRVDEGEP